MQENKSISELNKKLGVVISILLRMLPKEGGGLPLREQIRVLNNLGMRPKEIAEILGRTPGYINKELAILRKHEKDKKEEPEKR